MFTEQEQRMNNLGKVRHKGKIKKYPQDFDLLERSRMSTWDALEFPRHVWLSYSKKKDKWIINTYINPRFSKPKPHEEPNYHMPYKNNFDTPEGLLHQIKHMVGKRWFTRAMVNETMDIVNILHEKLTNKQHWGWSYGKEKLNERLDIINDD